MDIKILDCTLRDGGYINNWRFGADNIYTIASTLNKARIDFVECGFLTSNTTFSKNKTLYNCLSDIPAVGTKNLTIMVNFGEYDFNILQCNQCDIELRIAFKLNNLPYLDKYISPLKQKKIKFSLNAMHIGLYSENDINNLIEITNCISPQTLTIVDTMGILTPNEVKILFKKLNNCIDKKINFGFHVHNNLNYAFPDIKELLNMNLDRLIIIDSALGGLGRGSGILSTEVLAQYINSKFNTNYDYELINNLSNKIIKPIKKIYNFDDKYHYYLASKYKCHPNYAAYLKKLKLSYSKMEEIFSQIPTKNKTNFSKSIIDSFIK